MVVEEGHHVAELLDASGNVRLAGNLLEAVQASLGEACGDTCELMDDAEVGELSARQPEGGDGLGLVIVWRQRQLEALLREVGAALEADGLLWLRGDIFEDDAQQLVGKIEDTHFYVGLFMTAAEKDLCGGASHASQERAAEGYRV